MLTEDEEFSKRLRATFQLEAEEHVQTIAARLLELEKSPPAEQRATAIENVFREAHSLKSAARAVDLSEIEAMCQALEGVFAAWKRGETSPAPETFDTIHHTLDAINALLAPAESGEGAGRQRRCDELIRSLGRLQNHAPPASRGEGLSMAATHPEAAADQPAPGPRVEPEKAPAAETVRISISKLDSRLLQAEDMLTVKAMASHRASELWEAAGLFEQWRNEWAKVSSEARALRQGIGQRGKGGPTAKPGGGCSAALVDFIEWNGEFLRTLEDRLTALAMQAGRDRHSVAKRVDDLLEDSKKLLMLPFSTLAGMFPKLVRDLCRDQGKEAELVIRGGEIEIDKRILEEMKDVLVHTLRNCVDHGVEKPEERARLNKPPRATITITVSQANGNKVEIAISDDGGGVDVEKVRESAVRSGVLAKSDAGVMSDEESLALIFHSGVSTSPIITEISGRGLGMAIVRSKAEGLGGRVAIESRRNAATTLRITLPLTMATFRGILVACGGAGPGGGGTFVVPTVNVERVFQIKPGDIQTVENREAIVLEGRAVSLVRMDAVLGLPRAPQRGDESARLPVVVLHSAGQRIAFVVDDVLHEEEVLVKPLRKPLVRVRNISGATVLASGKAAPILNIADLMKSGRTHRPAPPATAAEKHQARSARVLVAEDSITSRMLLKGVLESAGYTVKTAVDGMDAFTALREHRFDLVVSDVEMPRMDGFDLTARIRADKRLAELPVVLVTALETREGRERGIDAGANAYIGKSGFDQGKLLEVIEGLV